MQVEAFLKCVCGLQEEIGGTNVPPQGLELMKLKAEGPREIQLWVWVSVWMWKLDCEEGWVPKNWCLCTVVLEKTLESPLDCKEIQPVHSEGDQPWDFFGRNDAKAEELTHWKGLWCWEGLGAGGEGDDRGWDGWMASLIQWMWV